MKDAYIQELESLALPVWEEDLERLHKGALEAALQAFDTASFGVPGSAELEVTHSCPVPGPPPSCNGDGSIQGPVPLCAARMSYALEQVCLSGT